MAFVNEILPPGNPERDKYGFSRWTIDRDRGVFLVSDGGGSKGKRTDFTLHRYSDGKPIVGFTATYSTTQTENGSHDHVNYQIVQLRPVPEFQDQWHNIVHFLRAALVEHGLTGRKIANHTITVEVPESVITKARG